MSKPKGSLGAKRKGMTAKWRRWLAQQQENRCGCGCGDKLERDAIGEHTTPVALGNDKRPDALYNYDCAYAKTYGKPGRIGGDIRDIAHIKRLAEGRTQFDKRQRNGAKLKSNGRLQGRGFDTSLRRRMDGTVERGR